MKAIILTISLLFFATGAFAAKADTIDVYSNSMNKNIEVVVVSPHKKNIASRVIYLLHGYSGNAKSWMGIKPDLPEIADKHNVIFVCPDGKNSWYWDSPSDKTSKYETFVSKELVSYIDANYSTIPVKNARAITGLSMGGHGALWLAFRHPDIFGAAGSMSGGVDIRPFPDNWEMSRQLGKIDSNKEVWEKHTVINQVELIKNGDLAIIVDCGYDDFFFEVNNNFHAKLLANKINHDYIVRPGGHDSNYWCNAIDYQILFFVKYFNDKK